jgi:hypothetical protein
MSRAVPASLAIALALATATTAVAWPEQYTQHPEVFVRGLFAKDIKCGGKDPNRYWCPVERAGSEKLALPEEKSVLVGFFTRAYEDQRSIVKEFDRSLSLAVLCLGTGAHQGKMVRIEEQDDARTKLMVAVRAAAQRALTGDGKSVDVPAAVYGEFQDLCRDYETVSGEMTLVDSSLEQDQPGANLFKVGPAYVVISVDSSSAAAGVGVFSTAPLRKK